MLAALQRQCSFTKQILRSCYQDRVYLAAAEWRYAQFLMLAEIYPNLFLVPMIDIDLMW
jgi:Glycine-rich domain-containing protein-like